MPEQKAHWFAVHLNKRLVRHVLVSGKTLQEAFEQVKKRYPNAEVFAVCEQDVMQKITDTQPEKRTCVRD